MKTVTLWTPVVIEDRFPSIVKALKLEYKTDHSLNSGEVPPHIEDLEGGVIINLPTSGSEHDLKASIDFSNLLSDDDLVSLLENHLDNIRLSKRLLNPS
jgi:hypothetical protein